MMQTEVLIKRLKSRAINPTAMRLLILDKLMNTEVALSLADLETEMDQADRITIYRTLKKFEENKLIHSIEDGTGSIKYALCELNCKCTPEFTHAHFHHQLAISCPKYSEENPDMVKQRWLHLDIKFCVDVLSFSISSAKISTS